MGYLPIYLEIICKKGIPRPLDDDEKEIAKKGRIRMGGCVVMPNTPTLFCNKCGYEWGTMIM